jgi:hypothetical protein
MQLKSLHVQAGARFLGRYLSSRPLLQYSFTHHKS